MRQNESSVTYNFPIVAQEGTTSVVDFDLWNVNKCRVSGTGKSSQSQFAIRLPVTT